MGGETQWSIVPAAAVISQVKAGRLRALAVSTPKRSPLLPDLPTIAEAGVAGYEYNAWNGVFAPRGTPRAVLTQWHSALQKVLAQPDVIQQYANQGLAPQGSESSAQFTAFLRADDERIARLAATAGLKPE
jgi:tripartite-type tricarboxylate transporter receptor subunit TctC